MPYRTRRPVRAAPSVPPESAFQLDAASLESSCQDFPYTLFAPLHYESGYAYPLLIWLHGEGADQRQLTRLMPQISMRNYIAIAPQGPVEAPGGAGFDWPDQQDQTLEAEQRVFACLRLATERLHVASGRVFLAGFGSGGTTALRLGTTHPDRFAGVLSLGGALPSGPQFLRNLSMLRHLPIFVAVGRKSPIYGPRPASDDLRLLHSAGIPISLREYPCGQEIMLQMLRDMDRWMIQQITAPQDVES